MDIDVGMVLTFVFVAYSIILHEIAHGYAALKFGDPTAKHGGRLSLSPIGHIDPIGTILFPLIQLLSTGQVFLGWARPVPVNPLNLRPRVKGEVVVALAGVATNLAIALLMAVLLGFETLVPPKSALFTAVWWTLFANVALAVFNLIPIPPLDGSHVFKYVLPVSMRLSYQRLGFYGIWILLALIASGALSWIIVGPLRYLVGHLLAIADLVRELGL